MSTQAAEKLLALRKLMSSVEAPHSRIRQWAGAIQAYIVPSEDAHQSEYVSKHDARRAWLSGFTGSAGTAVVTSNDARLWTDGRYFLQAEKQLDSNCWKMMKDRTKNAPTIESWLSEMMGDQRYPLEDKNAEAAMLGDPTALGGAVARVGIDPSLFSVSRARTLCKTLSKSGIALFPVEPNLVDLVWGAEQPPRPANPVFFLDTVYTGLTAAEKVAKVRAKLHETGAAAVILTSLDEIAWIFNIRGSDIACNPVAYSYAIVYADEDTSPTLYMDATGRLDENMIEMLNTRDRGNILVKEYNEILKDLEELSDRLLHSRETDMQGLNVLIDPATCNLAIFKRLNKTLVKEVTSPVRMLKCIKTEAEQQGFYACNRRDGIALVNFFAWVEEQMTKAKENAEKVCQEMHGKSLNDVDKETAGELLDDAAKKMNLTEYTADDKLLKYRQDQELFVNPSFDSIIGQAGNAAVIHYKAEKESALPLRIDRILLVDSGGQYLDGTTDTTRTWHFGSPTAFEKECYTRVLKGHIALASAIFPKGTMGHQLDAFARQFLWQIGLDYLHGTGHGVGSFLNVHEWPPSISFIPKTDSLGLVPGMAVSNEPGYYHSGEFGIRIENIVLTTPCKTPNQFGNTEFCQFKNLTCVPLQTKLVEPALLTDSEIQWLNEYNGWVREQLTPLVEKIDNSEDKERASHFLHRETQPLHR